MNRQWIAPLLLVLLDDVGVASFEPDATTLLLVQRGAVYLAGAVAGACCSQ